MKIKHFRIISKIFGYKVANFFYELGAEKHICPKREGIPINFPTPDHWVKRNNGDRCCSFCGSWHPDDFLNFCKDVISTNGEIGRIELADGRHKVYINREGIMNADYGAIKFYLIHINKEQWKDVVPIINEALKISWKIFEERFNKNRVAKGGR